MQLNVGSYLISLFICFAADAAMSPNGPMSGPLPPPLPLPQHLLGPAPPSLLALNASIAAAGQHEVRAVRAPIASSFSFAERTSLAASQWLVD